MRVAILNFRISPQRLSPQKWDRSVGMNLWCAVGFIIVFNVISVIAIAYLSVVKLNESVALLCCMVPAEAQTARIGIALSRRASGARHACGCMSPFTQAAAVISRCDMAKQRQRFGRAPAPARPAAKRRCLFTLSTLYA